MSPQVAVLPVAGPLTDIPQHLDAALQRKQQERMARFAINKRIEGFYSAGCCPCCGGNLTEQQWGIITPATSFWRDDRVTGWTRGCGSCRARIHRKFVHESYYYDHWAFALIAPPSNPDARPGDKHPLADIIRELEEEWGITADKTP